MDIIRHKLNDDSHLQDLEQLSGLTVNHALKYSEQEFLSNDAIGEIAKCFKLNVRKDLWRKGDAHIFVAHVSNQSPTPRFSQYYIFDPLRPDGEVADQDPILIPQNQDGTLYGYAYQMCHNVNDRKWENKHIDISAISNISSICENSAMDVNSVSSYVPGLSAQFSDPIAELERQLDSVNKYWDFEDRRKCRS